MLLSWDCIIKILFKLAGHLVFNSGSNESSLAPQFKWLDNTFKAPGPFYLLWKNCKIYNFCIYIFPVIKDDILRPVFSSLLRESTATLHPDPFSLATISSTGGHYVAVSFFYQNVYFLSSSSSVWHVFSYIQGCSKDNYLKIYVISGCL